MLLLSTKQYLIIKCQIWCWKNDTEMLPISPKLRYTQTFLQKNYTCKKSLAWRTEISVGVLDGLNCSTVNNSNLTPIGRLLLKEYVIKDGLSPNITKASGFILSTFKILKMLITFCWLVSQDIFSFAQDAKHCWFSELCGQIMQVSESTPKTQFCYRV